MASKNRKSTPTTNMPAPKRKRYTNNSSNKKQAKSRAPQNKVEKNTQQERSSVSKSTSLPNTRDEIRTPVVEKASSVSIPSKNNTSSSLRNDDVSITSSENKVTEKPEFFKENVSISSLAASTNTVVKSEPIKVAVETKSQEEIIPEIKEVVDEVDLTVDKEPEVLFRLVWDEGFLPIKNQDYLFIGTSHADLELPKTRNGIATGVSKRHLLVENDGRMVFITDLRSTNGTYLNGSKIPVMEKTLLRKGDEIRLGRIYLYFHGGA